MLRLVLGKPRLGDHRPGEHCCQRTSTDLHRGPIMASRKASPSSGLAAALPPLSVPLTSVASEVGQDKGLRNMVVFRSVASFGKSLVINDCVFPLRAIRDGESVGSQGSTCTLDPAAVARAGAFPGPDVLGRIPESASSAERGRLSSGLEKQNPLPRPIPRGWQP